MPDQPQKRGWQERLLDQIDHHLESRRDNRVQRLSSAVNFTPEQHALISESARLRGISMTAYMRRAALAFATYDFGMDWDQTMANEQKVSNFGGTSKEAESLGGSGRGPWVIGHASEH